MRCTVVLVAGLASLFPLAALAQEGKQPGKDSESAAAKYGEVERGAWISSDIGAIFYFSVPGEGGAFSNGALIGFEAGYDVTPRLQLGIVGWGQSVGADASYKGIEDPATDPKRARGDFHSFLAGASARFSFLTIKDENEVERTHLYLRASGGLAMSRPVGVIDDSGFYVLGGPGVEYFTRLRHFSVGLELDGIATIVGSGTAVGATVLPHLTYSF